MTRTLQTTIRHSYVSFSFRMIKTAAQKNSGDFVKQAIETTVSKTIEEIKKKPNTDCGIKKSKTCQRNKKT